MSQPFFCSYPSQILDIVSLFHFSHSDRYIIVFHCGFILPFHGDYNEVGHIFISFLPIWITSLSKMPAQIFCSFFFLAVYLFFLN